MILLVSIVSSYESTNLPSSLLLSSCAQDDVDSSKDG